MAWCPATCVSYLNEGQWVSIKAYSFLSVSSMPPIVSDDRTRFPGMVIYMCTRMFICSIAWSVLVCTWSNGGTMYKSWKTTHEEFIKSRFSLVGLPSAHIFRESQTEWSWTWTRIKRSRITLVSEIKYGNARGGSLSMNHHESWICIPWKGLAAFVNSWSFSGTQRQRHLNRIKTKKLWCFAGPLWSLERSSMWNACWTPLGGSCNWSCVLKLCAIV